jgi:hypothetical protein
MPLKPTTYRSKKYLKFIESLACSVEDNCCDGDIVAHHASTGGVGMKGSDLSCIALCARHHSCLHHNGKDTFERTSNVSIETIRRESLEAYIRRIEG